MTNVRPAKQYGIRCKYILNRLYAGMYLVPEKSRLFSVVPIIGACRFDGAGGAFRILFPDDGVNQHIEERHHLNGSHNVDLFATGKQRFKFADQIRIGKIAFVD